MLTCIWLGSYLIRWTLTHKIGFPSLGTEEPPAKGSHSRLSLKKLTCLLTKGPALEWLSLSLYQQGQGGNGHSRVLRSQAMRKWWGLLHKSIFGTPLLYKGSVIMNPDKRTASKCKQIVFPHAPSNFSNTVPQQCLISEEWVTNKDKRWSGFIFSNVLFSYKEFNFICSDTII